MTESTLPLGILHLVFLVVGVIGTTFSGRPFSWMGLGGQVSLTNKVSKVSRVLSMGLDFQPTTSASAPFVTQHSMASLFLIITGIPIHMDSLPG